MPAPKTILIVDCEPALREALAGVFTREGYQAETIEGLLSALHCLNAAPYDLMLVGLQKADAHTPALLSLARELHPDLLMILLAPPRSLKQALGDLPQGGPSGLASADLPSGALAFPPGLPRPEAALAGQPSPGRLQNILNEVTGMLAELSQLYAPAGQEGRETIRPYCNHPDHLAAPAARRAAPAERYLQCGPFVLDRFVRQVSRAGKHLPLPSGAFEYFHTLARYNPLPLSYQALVNESQESQQPAEAAQKTARWRIHQLRQALEPDPHNPVHILTVRGYGYRLEAEPSL